MWGLEHHDIWGDEAVSIALAQLPLATVLSPGGETTPPLYHLLLHYWIFLTGDSPAAVRFLSVIPGMPALAATFTLAYRLGGRRAALAALFLAAISPLGVYYSQEARMYMWMTALGTLSLAIFVRLYAPPVLPPRWLRWGILYAVVSVAVLYTHHFAIFIIAAQSVFVAWRWRVGLRRAALWLGIHTAIFLTYLPWLVAQWQVLTHIQFVEKGEVLHFELLDLPTLWKVVRRTIMAFSMGTTMPAEAWWLALISVVLAGIGLVVALRARVRGGIGGLAIAAVIASVLGAWLLSPILPSFYERYAMAALFAYLTLAAIGLTALRRFRWVSGAALAAVAMINGLSLRNYYTDPAYAKSQYSQMIAFVEAQAQPGDALLLLNTEQMALFNYYAPEDIPAYWSPPGSDWDDLSAQAFMEEIARSHSRLWVVSFGDWLRFDPQRRLAQWLNDRALLAYHTDFLGETLELYVVGEIEPSQTVIFDFGESIRLTGYGLSSTTISPGGTIQIALAWESLGSAERDYTIFTHLIDDQGRIAAQVDSQPAGGLNPTSAWQAGDVSTDRFALQIGPDAQPGLYWIEVGWYDLATLQRLPVTDGAGNPLGDRVLLVQIEIN